MQLVIGHVEISEFVNISVFASKTTRELSKGTVVEVKLGTLERELMHTDGNYVMMKFGI